MSTAPGSPAGRFPYPRGDALRLLAMMGLFFLVVCAVGILRPIKNALALDGLGAAGFYKVYLVSAVVMVFVLPYNRLADRLPWRWLIPGVAIFFASHLFIFRLFYQEGSAAYGLLFYGWYDLFAAASVTQFFMATQLFFNARNAKQAYPMVIAGGAVGATLGGAITALLAERMGAPDLLLVAATLIILFGIGIPFVWAAQPPKRAEREGIRNRDAATAGLREVFVDRHVRLIAATVLLSVLVKQLVDYQFNARVAEAFVTRDAITAFQGKFIAATQWIPIVVVLLIRPLLTRWGVGASVLLLPLFILMTNVAIGVAWTVGTVAVAKAAETSLRYSSERTAREILYVPVPEAIKLKAKMYIDVGLEEGLGKVLSAGLIFVLLALMPHSQIAWVAAALAVAWLYVAMGIRREYVRTLARAIEGRVASLRGVFVGLGDASTRPLIREALTGGDVLRIAFALELIEQAGAGGAQPFAAELRALLEHPSRDIRARAVDALAGEEGALDRDLLGRMLGDRSRHVREAAVRAMCASSPGEADDTARILLASPELKTRTAVLACLTRGELPVEPARVLDAGYLSGRESAAREGDIDARIEVALAAAALGPVGDGGHLLDGLLEDPDPRVAAVALRSAGAIGRPEHLPVLIRALRLPETREAAREGLALQGAAAVAALEQALLDEGEDARVRRAIPSVLARIPTPESVTLLLDSFLAPETDQVLDFRTLKALNKLRARHPELHFPAARVQEIVRREVGAAEAYASAINDLDVGDDEHHHMEMLRRAVRDAWSERREGVFRALGLVHAPEGMYRCFLAIAGGSPDVRATAMEWLEQTAGHAAFQRLAPVLAAEPGPHGASQDAGATLAGLWDDGDSWIARCALAVSLDRRLPGAAERLAHVRTLTNRELREFAEALHPESQTQHPNGNGTMDPIEKVFLLQQVDLLQGARSGHLALLGSIAEEIDVDPGVELLRRETPTDAMYVVVRGEIELEGVGGEHFLATDGSAFGTWALIDEAPSMVGARAVGEATLLRITRADFYDLLADHPELALGLLQGLARRIRTLVT